MNNVRRVCHDPVQEVQGNIDTGLQDLQQAAHHNNDAVVECLQHMLPSYHPNRRVREDHTVEAAVGNTGLFSRDEVAQGLEKRGDRIQGEG